MKAVRISLILSAGIIIVGLGFSVFLMFWGPDRLQWEGKSLEQILFDEGVLGTFIVVAVSLAIAAGTLWRFLRVIFPTPIKNGVTSQAKVLKVWDTGASINDDPQVGLLLKVTPEYGEPFQAEAKTLVSRLNVALVQPGVKADVIYDPLKPQRLQVQTLHLDGNGGTRAVSRMEELNELRDKRLIAEEEYRQKREEILKEL